MKTSSNLDPNLKNLKNLKNPFEEFEEVFKFEGPAFKFEEFFKLGSKFEEFFKSFGRPPGSSNWEQASLNWEPDFKNGAVLFRRRPCDARQLVGVQRVGFMDDV